MCGRALIRRANRERTMAAPNDSINERFYAWAKENPEAIGLFLKFAREAKASGRKRYSVNAIAERVRWHVNIETKGDEFKINDHWTAPMARLLARIDPTLEGFFEL